MSPHYVCNELEDLLSREIGERNSSVQKIYAKQDGDRVTVWTVVDQFSSTSCDKVYSAEERLMDARPEVLFDFHVLDASEYSEHLGAPVAYTRQ